MTKKKRKGPTLDLLLQRPWCYYCERDFDDMMILTSHQKAKHFKCERCGRRLNTAGGLSVHMNQVHKEQLEKVENALPNRGGLEVEIFGTEGIPEDAVRDHQQRVIQNFHQDAAAHQARTGNPHSGSKDGPLSKRPKLPPPGELKRQLREYVAKKNQAKGISDTAPSPGGAATVQQSNGYHERQQFQQGVPGFAPQGFQHPVSASPQNAGIAPPPGLPQRPQQPTPPVNNWQDLHHGRLPPEESQKNAADAVQTTEAATTGATPAKASTKTAKKGQPTRLKLNRTDISPEETLSNTSRYFFDLNAAQPGVLGEVTGAVTGAVDEMETNE